MGQIFPVIDATTPRNKELEELRTKISVGIARDDFSALKSIFFLLLETERGTTSGGLHEQIANKRTSDC